MNIQLGVCDPPQEHLDFIGQLGVESAGTNRAAE